MWLIDNNEDFMEVLRNADIDPVAVLAHARGLAAYAQGADGFVTLSVSTVNVVDRGRRHLLIPVQPPHRNVTEGAPSWVITVK